MLCPIPDPFQLAAELRMQDKLASNGGLTREEPQHNSIIKSPYSHTKDDSKIEIFLLDISFVCAGLDLNHKTIHYGPG